MSYGFLAELATVLTIILIVQVYAHFVVRGLTDADFGALGQRVGLIVGTLGGTLYTYLFARALARRVASRFVAHGVVVAVTAIAFSVAGSIVGHRGVPSGYVFASVLKLAAGALAGFLYSRSVSLNRSVV